MGSAQVILLDTHTLVWMDDDSPKLGHPARKRIEKAFRESDLAVSAIRFIAATALRHRATLVTADERLLAALPGLTFQDARL